MRNYLHYENNGKKWLWYWHSWTNGKTNAGDWYVTKYYCTNDDGEGLFVVYPEKNERKQLRGTCQFSLAGLKDPKRAIRRLYEEEDA